MRRETSGVTEMTECRPVPDRDRIVKTHVLNEAPCVTVTKVAVLTVEDFDDVEPRDRAVIYRVEQDGVVDHIMRPGGGYHDMSQVVEQACLSENDSGRQPSLEKRRSLTWS